MNRLVNYIGIAIICAIVIAAVYSNRPKPAVSTVPIMAVFKYMPTSRIILQDPARAISWTETRSPQKQSNSIWPTTNTPLVVDQGQWGSCTAFAVRYAFLLWLRRNGMPLIEPSMSFWYAKARLLEDASLRDIGASISGLVKVVKTQGFVTNTQWPYTAANIFIAPPRLQVAAFNGTIQQIPQYAALPGISKWQTQAEAFVKEIDDGKSVLIGIHIFSSIESVQVLVTGVIPKPQGNLLGGHAICLVGYVRGATPEDSVFQFYNSWGIYSGLSGLFTIPFSYAGDVNVSSDWWSF